MKIETKYDIGDDVWVVTAYNGIVSVFDGVLASIAIDEKENIEYMLDETYDYYPENQIVRKEDNEGLCELIKTTMKQIREEEKNNGV